MTFIEKKLVLNMRKSKLESANMSHGSSFLSLQVSIAPPPQLAVPPLQVFLQVAAATLLQVSATPPSPSLYSTTYKT